MLLVLTGVTMVSVGLLAVGNELTKEPIAEAKMKTLNDALRLVEPEFSNNPVAEADTVFDEQNGKRTIKFILYPAKRDGKLVGTAVQATSNGFSGEITVLVGFDAEGNIFDYSLLSHSETPGLGSKADLWFKKGGKGDIIGKNPGKSPLSVRKDNGDVDAITASTITSRAFLNAVNSAYLALRGDVNATTSASQQVQTDANSSATPQHTDADSSATLQVDSTSGATEKVDSVNVNKARKEYINE